MTYQATQDTHRICAPTAMLDTLSDGIVLVSTDGILVLANLAAEQLLGRLCQDTVAAITIVGNSWSALFPESTCPGWQEFFRRAGQTHEQIDDVLRVEFNGAVRRFALTARPCRMDDGTADTHLVVIREVTVEFSHLQQQADLQNAANRGSEISWITHDMNNFLGMILGGVEIAQINLGKGNMEKVTASLEKVKTNVGKAEQFTSALAESTRMATRKVRASLNDLVTEVAMFARTQQRFANLQLRLNLDAAPASFELDRDQMALLLLSMLTNAADAVNETKRPDGVVTITTSHDSEIAHLTVSDNGVGIPANVKDRLFRAHLTTKPNARGYGLANCARILANHEGTFSISSEPGQGATFSLCFPLWPAVKQPQPETTNG
jgi:signal transduction histidine kinase